MIERLIHEEFGQVTSQIFFKRGKIKFFTGPDWSCVRGI
jgi:hypothetical protein